MDSTTADPAATTTPPAPATHTAAGHKIVPAPALGREVSPGEVWVEIDGVVLPELDPELQARFDAMDAATVGMTQVELLAALNGPDGGRSLLHPATAAGLEADLNDDTPAAGA